MSKKSFGARKLKLLNGRDKIGLGQLSLKVENLFFIKNTLNCKIEVLELDFPWKPYSYNLLQIMNRFEKHK
jgi:hypothetical protein